MGTPMTRMSDAERVLGQIERGEVRAGPDAAREIAARHEAAYGAAWPTARPRRTELTIMRPSRRPQADHAAVATHARHNPGIWIRVGEYSSKPSATATAWVIRTAGNGKPGSGHHYAPAGAFETDTRLTEYGYEVRVRFVGEPSGTAEDEAGDDALASVIGGAA